MSPGPFSVEALRLREYQRQCCSCVRIDRLDGSDESVAALGQCFNKARILGVVAQSLAQFVDGDAQAVVEVNGRVRAPKLAVARASRETTSPGCSSNAASSLKGWLCRRIRTPERRNSPALQIGFKDTELHPPGAAPVLFRSHECGPESCTGSVYAESTKRCSVLQVDGLSNQPTYRGDV